MGMASISAIPNLSAKFLCRGASLVATLQLSPPGRRLLLLPQPSARGDWPRESVSCAGHSESCLSHETVDLREAGPGRTRSHRRSPCPCTQVHPAPWHCVTAADCLLALTYNLNNPGPHTEVPGDITARQEPGQWI